MENTSKDEMCNGETWTELNPDTLEPWHARCKDCDAQNYWDSLPNPHVKDKDYA